MPLGVGACGQAGIVKEASYGAGGTAATFLELISEDIHLEQEKIPAGHVLSSRAMYKYWNGSEDVLGSFTIEANPDNLGLLLYMAMGVEGNATQVGSTTAYDHTFSIAGRATDLGSFAMEIDRGLGSGDTFLYKGMMIDTMGLNFAKGQIMQAEFGCVGQRETDDQDPQSLTGSTKKPYVFDFADVKADDYGGTPATIAYVNSISFQMSNFLDADGGFVMDGNAYRNHCYKTRWSLTGTMELEYTTTADVERDAYRDNTQREINVIVTTDEEPDTGYYYTLTLDIPCVHYLSAPVQISGRDRVAYSVDFEAVYDSTNLMTIVLRDAKTTKYSA